MTSRSCGDDMRVVVFQGNHKIFKQRGKPERVKRSLGDFFKEKW